MSSCSPHCFPATCHVAWPPLSSALRPLWLSFRSSDVPGSFPAGLGPWHLVCPLPGMVCRGRSILSALSLPRWPMCGGAPPVLSPLCHHQGLTEEDRMEAGRSAPRPGHPVVATGRLEVRVIRSDASFRNSAMAAQKNSLEGTESERSQLKTL